MEFQELVEARRSIRSYKPDCSIDKETIEKILLCAQQAPSWKNSETGRYYVVSSPEMVAKIKETALPEMNRTRSVNAPVLIVTAFEKGISGFGPNGEQANEPGNEWGAYDLGLQNALLILKAKELGLDTLIMGLRDADVLRNELHIPDSQEVVSVIALGYRDSDPEKPVRKKLDEIVSFS